MRVESLSVLLPANPLARAYTAHFERVSDLYQHNPHEGSSFFARARQLDGREGAPREEVAAVLSDYNRAIGNSEAAVANAERLADGSTLCVVTGQQVGVLTGPLYTVYKAVQTIALARELSQELGRPVVPVFWLASEDHDLTEIDHMDLTDQEGELRRLRLEMEMPSRRSAGAMEAGPPAMGLVEEVLALLPEAEFRASLSGHLSRLTAQGGSLADWFARLLAWLLGEQGLVLVDPMQPRLRQLAGPFFRRLLEQSEAISDALREGCDRARALGFDPAVRWEPDSANLFTYHQGQRLLLIRRDGGFATRQGEVSWTAATAMERAVDFSEEFSGNVVTRPLVQDYLLPTIAYVAGPGEISYYGLYRQVYAAAGLTPPVFVPRSQVVLVEPTVSRYLKKLGLTLGEALLDLEGARKRYLERHGGLDVHQLFAAFRKDFDARYSAVLSQVKGLDRSLEQVAAENLRQIHAQFSRMEEKVHQQQRKSSEVAMRQFDRVSQQLLPRGQFQERVFNIVPYLAKFGPGLISPLLEAPLARGGAFAVWLGED